MQRDFPYNSTRSTNSNSSFTGISDRSANNGKSPSPSWSAGQEIRGTVGGVVPWQCVPDRVYPVSGYGPPKNINQAAYQNRSNNNPESTVGGSSTFKSPAAAQTQAQVDANRNCSTAAATDDAKHTTAAAGVKSSKSFESGVLGQHANTPNGIIPWPGDRKPRQPQWDQQQHHHQNHQHHQHHHNNVAAYNGSASSAYGGEIFLGNRSSGIRSSSRGGCPTTYFSPQHNHVDRLSNAELRSSASLEEILSPILQSKLTT